MKENLEKFKDYEDMDDLELATWIAEHAHCGQFRWDGVTPFVEHPKAVARSLEGVAYKCVALLHDVVEDTEMTLQDLLDIGVEKHIVDAVDAITHRDDEDYFGYLQRVKKNVLARVVKIADIKNNLESIVKNYPKKVDKRDKYILAINFLETGV